MSGQRQRRGSGGIPPPGNFVEKNMRGDKIWCILRQFWEMLLCVRRPRCVWTIFLIWLLIYCDDNNIFWGGEKLGILGREASTPQIPLKEPWIEWIRYTMSFFSLTALQHVSARSHIKNAPSSVALTKHPSLIGKNKGKSPDSVNRFMTKDNKLKGNKFWKYSHSATTSHNWQPLFQTPKVFLAAYVTLLSWHPKQWSNLSIRWIQSTLS